MKVLVTESFNTLKGNIPAGKIIEIPDTMFSRLMGKVAAISPEQIYGGILISKEHRKHGRNPCYR